MLRSAACLILFLLTCAGGHAEEEFDADSLVFQNVFCSRAGDKISYSIVGAGAFRAPRTDDLETFIVSWLNRHPHATAKVIEQSSLGPKLGVMDYIWIEKGSDSLNIDLVRAGIVPGGMMADGVDYLTSIKDVAHIDPRSPDFPKRLVSDAEYKSFIDEVVKAEVAARADKVGLWSDEYREMMREEGFLPE